MENLWRPCGRVVKYVFVKFNEKITIFMCSDCSIPAEKVVEIYGYRFRIEDNFKVEKNILGTLNYHFWGKNLKSTFTSTFFLSQQTKQIQELFLNKLKACNTFVSLGIIAQGLMIMTGIIYQEKLWVENKLWMRTKNVNEVPSEWFVAQCLKNSSRKKLAKLIIQAILTKLVFSKGIIS